MANMHLLTEDVITLQDACDEFPSKPKYPTVWRWGKKGFEYKRGHRVHLETLKLGHTTVTSKQACTRFLEAINRGHPARG